MNKKSAALPSWGKSAAWTYILWGSRESLEVRAAVYNTTIKKNLQFKVTLLCTSNAEDTRFNSSHCSQWYLFNTCWVLPTTLSQKIRIGSLLSWHPAKNPVPDAFKFDMSFGSEDQGQVVLICETKTPQMMWTCASESFREHLDTRCLWELTNESCKEKKTM